MVIDEFRNRLSPEQWQQLELLKKGEKIEEMLNWIDRTIREMTDGQWNLDMYLRMNPVNRLEKLKKVIHLTKQARKNKWTM